MDWVYGLSSIIQRPQCVEEPAQTGQSQAELMTGHGCFNRYLHRIGHASSVEFIHGGPTEKLGDEQDDTPYTIACCEELDCDGERLVLKISLFDQDVLVSLIFECPTYWRMETQFAEDVMTAKKRVEVVRQSPQVIAPSRRARCGRLRWLATR